MERLYFVLIHFLLFRGFLGAANIQIISKIYKIRFIGFPSTLGKHTRTLLAVDGMRVGHLYVVMLHDGLVYLSCYRLTWSV